MIEPKNVKGNPPSSFKKYSRKYCDKANCTLYSESNCKNNLYPANNNKAKRLYKSTGYCDSYITEFEENFRDKALRILQKEQDKFVRKLNREISRIEQIPKEEFAHNIASPRFNPTTLTIFISLENNLDKYYRPKKNGEDEIDKACKTFQEASELPETSESLRSVFNGMVNSLKQQIPTTEVRAKNLGDENLREAKELGTRSTETYREIKEELIEICNRGFGGKAYKQKTQTFLIKHKLILKEYSEHIKFLKKYRTKLLLRNKLLNGLFTGEKNSYRKD